MKGKVRKTIGRLLSLIAVAALVMGITAASVLPANAASVTVNDVLNGETYTAYQLLHYTTNGSNGYSYYLTEDEYETSNTSLVSLLNSAGFTFAESPDGSRYYVSNASSLNADSITASLNTTANKTTLAASGGALSTATATGESGSATIDLSDKGYYFIDTTTGSLCELKSYSAQQVILEKNTVPTVDKTQSLTESNYSDNLINGNIGDKVYYHLEVTDGKGTDSKITLTDTLSTGLTYNAGTLKIGDTAVDDDADTTNYKVTVSGQTITIELKADYVKTLTENSKVIITYNATVNSSAVVDNATGNSNTVQLAYSKQTSQDIVYLATYDFLLKKTDGSNFLSGAGFKLYDAATGGNQIKVSSDSTGYYVDSNGSDSTEITPASASGVNVRGLKNGTYYLEETTVPDGYSPTAGRTEVTISSGQTTPVEITVVNNTSSLLPSTGGAGVYAFYAIGGVLVAGAVVLLIRRRKAE